MKELAKRYESGEVEGKWYSAWEASGVFKGDVDDVERETYSIMIPPPNVTGILTMGHVLNNTIQDILVRRARQEGKNVMWLPGTDHAGIATQTKVERELKAEGKSKYDLGREGFVERVKEWRDEHGGKIVDQLKRLGASCDWGRMVHTLDEDYSEAVLTAFVKLYERGYVYRGKRMVNWCPVSLTALSDEEVVMKASKGILYKVRYELVDEPGRYLEVSTTRPETIMGDVALAVNPGDERYKDLVGKKVWRPINREQIPIVADEAVEMEFGTGVLKVTPAHDIVDFEIGARHGLEVLDVMNEDGTMSELAGEEFSGMDRFEARKLVGKKLEQMGSLVEEEVYENNVGYSERADVVIEPRVSEQWFMKYPKVEEAKEMVRGGKIGFWPKRWEKTYLHWLEGIQDWCISRQLWWGHRIPVWYRKGEDRSEPGNWHVSLKGPEDIENWEQDEDVLDTWASSWLWPFATMGWPDEKRMEAGGLYKFFPTSALVTGPDIIFFWVARMIMASLEFMGEEKEKLEEDEMEERKAFENVYFTGIVRDASGRKMSKSLGNSPDPIGLIEKYGADGLRFGIMSIAAQGQDVMFSEERVEYGKRFCTKLWNASRFRQMNGGVDGNQGIKGIVDRMDVGVFDADDHAILLKLLDLLDMVKEGYEKYQFMMVAQGVSGFFWGDYCDWYVEVAKTKLEDEEKRGSCLAIQDLVLRVVLQLLHPYMPFITEELWHGMGYGEEGKFIGLEYVGDGEWMRRELFLGGIELEGGAKQEIDDVSELVSGGRALKAAFQLGSKKDVKFSYISGDIEHEVICRHKDKIMKLLGAGELERVGAVEGRPGEVVKLGALYMNLEGEVDVASEILRLEKELEKLCKQVKAGEGKLGDKRFMENAPEKIVEGARAQLLETKRSYDEVERLLKMFQK